MAKLPEAVRSWRDDGAFTDLLGHRIYFRNEPGQGTPILLLHGFPSASFDWRHLIPHLGGRAWIALDFLGFGLSEKPRATNDLRRQADLVETLLMQLGVGEVQVVAHDMGTSVANELMARDLEGRLRFQCDQALLFNGSMVIKAASLTWEQRVLTSRAGFLLAALSNPLSLRRGLGATFSDAHPLTRSEADCQWALMSRDGGHRRLHQLSAYIAQRTEFADRWHGAIADWEGDLALAWGMKDPVATPAVLGAVRALRPEAPVHELPDLGHYPQIEDPGAIARAIGPS